MGAMMEFFAGAVMLFVELIVLLVVVLLRGRRVRDWPGEHVSIPLGESVARLARRTKIIKLFVALGACALLWQGDHGITAVLLAPIALYWFIDAVRAHFVVHRFEQPVNRLERRLDWLLVDHTLLYCGRRAWSRASSVPTASAGLRRRD